MTQVKIKRLNENAVIPKYAHDFDAGFDLVATEDVIVEPGETVKVPTGLAFELPPHYEMQIRPRSGVTLKTKLRVQFGTVDAGYRGEVGVIVDNVASDPFSSFDHYPNGIDGKPIERQEQEYEYDTYIIRKGDRIAQAVIKPIEQAQFIEVDTLSETARGEGGFGSSGVKAND
jgi:dUTP pyrophosphatase